MKDSFVEFVVVDFVVDFAVDFAVGEMVVLLPLRMIVEGVFVLLR